MTKKVLGLFCHPDDELICGWPILQNDRHERHIAFCCDDKSRHGNNRVLAAADVCSKFGMVFEGSLSLDNNFHNTPTRHQPIVLRDIIATLSSFVVETIAKVEPDVIVTHNPFGEYGHGAHRFLHSLLLEHPYVKNVICSDVIESDTGGCHLALLDKDYIRYRYFESKLFSVGLDVNFYMDGMGIYKQRKAWTWKNKLPDTIEAGVFLMKGRYDV